MLDKPMGALFYQPRRKEMKRDYLVFVRAGTKSLHHSWMNYDGEDRLWDLQVSQYDDDPDIGKNGDLPLSRDKGTKWDSVYRYLESNSQIMWDYKYILFADDDVEISCKELNRFFKICDEYELLVAQPSLHPESYFCYSILLKCAFTRLRYTNFVECMAPAIRTDYLRERVLRYLADTKSGWGLDLVWTLWMDEPKYRSAVVDEVSMRHTRPHATGEKGSLYADLGRTMNMTPRKELEKFVGRFEGIPSRMLTYGAVLSNGKPTNGIITRFLNGLYLVWTLPRCREKKRMFFGGLGMLIRTITAAGYIPRRVGTNLNYISVGSERIKESTR